MIFLIIFWLCFSSKLNTLFTFNKYYYFKNVTQGLLILISIFFSTVFYLYRLTIHIVHMGCQSVKVEEYSEKKNTQRRERNSQWRHRDDGDHEDDDRQIDEAQIDEMNELKKRG